MADIEAADLLARRCTRHPSATRLEAEDPAARRRDANRTRAVTPARRGNHAGCHGCRGAPGGPAHGPLEVPGIQCRAEQDGLGRGVVAEFRRVGATDDEEAGRPVGAHERAVGRGPEVPERARSGRLGHARLARPEVLEQERHSSQRPLRQWPAGLLAGRLEERRDDGVDRRVQRLDALDRGVEQLDGRSLSSSDEIRLADRVEARELGHAASSAGSSYAACPSISVSSTRASPRGPASGANTSRSRTTRSASFPTSTEPVTSSRCRW